MPIHGVVGVLQRSTVSIYTNCEGDHIDLGGDEAGDGDVVVDDEDGTSPHIKGVQVEMTVLNSPRRRPRSGRISPLLEKKRTFAATAVSQNYIKIGRPFFHGMEVS
jgi:hypothetical protein